MPRHSPCALSSLTLLVASSAPFRSRLPTITPFASLQRLVFKRFFGSLELCRQFYGRSLFKIVTLHLSVLSTIKTFNLLLPCFSLFSIVQFSRCDFLLSFETRMKYSNPFEYFIPFSNGGPEWARTTDLTIISRTL